MQDSHHAHSYTFSRNLFTNFINTILSLTGHFKLLENNNSPSCEMSSAMIMSLVLTIHGFTCQTPTDDTVQWLKRNNQVFNNMFYTEKEISSLKDSWEETNSERVSVAVITEIKTFWTKLSPSVACPNDGYRNRRLSRDICSTCCST